MKKLLKKLHSAGGVSRLVGILLVLVVVLLVAVLVPVYLRYQAQAQLFACNAALDNAQQELNNTYLTSPAFTAAQGKEAVTAAMLGWTDLCPAGGDCYIMERDWYSDKPYELVCGLHNSDEKERCALNAKHVADDLREALRVARLEGEKVPDSLTVTLNGRAYSASRVVEATALRHGTGSTVGYSGTVIFFGVAGEGKVGEDSGLKNGELCYLSFADENYCANWSAKAGWTGDAY